MEGAIPAANQGKQLVAVVLAPIRYLGPIVTNVHDGVIESEFWEIRYGFRRENGSSVKIKELVVTRV